MFDGVQKIFAGWRSVVGEHGQGDRRPQKIATETNKTMPQSKMPDVLKNPVTGSPGNTGRSVRIAGKLVDLANGQREHVISEPLRRNI